MPETRVQIIGEKKFDERTWLRREVLWASLITPYSIQWGTWINGTAIDQHNGNFSRATLYSENKLDIDSQALAFFNQGKNVAGIISSSAVFRTMMYDNPRNDDEELSDYVIRTQAKCVDIALGNVAARCIELPSDISSYKECQRLAVLSDTPSRLPGEMFARRHRLLRAGKVMSALARVEVENWRNMAKQDPENLLPNLVVYNGGHPRSAGPRVDRLQPIFHEIVSSEEFQTL